MRSASEGGATVTATLGHDHVDQSGRIITGQGARGAPEPEGHDEALFTGAQPVGIPPDLGHTAVVEEISRRGPDRLLEIAPGHAFFDHKIDVAVDGRKLGRPHEPPFAGHEVNEVIQPQFGGRHRVIQAKSFAGRP